jgi:hypothetical protein
VRCSCSVAGTPSTVRVAVIVSVFGIVAVSPSLAYS